METALVKILIFVGVSTVLNPLITSSSTSYAGPVPPGLYVMKYSVRPSLHWPGQTWIISTTWSINTGASTWYRPSYNPLVGMHPLASQIQATFLLHILTGLEIIFQNQPKDDTGLELILQIYPSTLIIQHSFASQVPSKFQDMESCSAYLLTRFKSLNWIHSKVETIFQVCNRKYIMPTRKEVLNFLTNWYILSGLMPWKKPCTLRSIGLDIDVPVHPFLGCIYSPLTSPELMKSENLIFKDFQRSWKSFLCSSLEWLWILWWNWF